MTHAPKSPWVKPAPAKQGSGAHAMAQKAANEIRVLRVQLKELEKKKTRCGCKALTKRVEALEAKFPELESPNPKPENQD